MIAIRYAHAGDLPTDEVHELVWNVGTIGDRYQEIAIVGNRVVGSWTYALELKRGRHHVDSGHTDVQPRFRRKGVARALWFHGIKRWDPRSIDSRIGSDEGKYFLARMLAEIQYRMPDVQMRVQPRKEDMECWESVCNWAAQELLGKLGNQAREAKASPMKLLKGGAA